MKMGTGIFWGIVLILIGLGVIIRIVFNVDFPIIKILVAFFFIFIGIRILMGDRGVFHFHNTTNDVIFSENSFKASGNKEYNVVFGKANYDFRDIVLTEKVRVDLHTVFGGAEIRLKKGTPVRIKVESAFGGANMPNGNSTAFGTTLYESPNFNPDSAHLYIKADVVFGGLNVILE
jgi:hypothetical protein